MKKISLLISSTIFIIILLIYLLKPKDNDLIHTPTHSPVTKLANDIKSNTIPQSVHNKNALNIAQQTPKCIQNTSSIYATSINCFFKMKTEYYTIKCSDNGILIHNGILSNEELIKLGSTIGKSATVNNIKIECKK